MGLIDPGFSNPTLTDHLATLAQFTGMGMVLRSALGRRWAAMEQRADQQMEYQLRLPQVLTDLVPQRGFAMNGGEAKKLERKSTQIWTMDGEGGLASSFSERPALTTPKNIFPWTLQRDVETPVGTIYLEHGGQKDLSQDPLAVQRIKDLENQVKQLFSKESEKTSEGFRGLLGRILKAYPGFLWAMKRDLSQAGYKIWMQLDAERGDLRNLLLLDGVDRPRQGLLTLPHGREALELKVGFHPSGLPQIQGNYLSLNGLKPDRVEAFDIRRVSYNGAWEESLNNPQVQLQLFSSKSFIISMFHQREIPIAIQYSMGDRRARWDWLVQPFFGPMLRLDTRYEEYKIPTAKILKEVVTAKPEPKSAVEKEIKPQPAPKNNSAPAIKVKLEKQPRPKLDPLIPFKVKLIERLNEIDEWGEKSPSTRARYLRQILYELRASNSNEEIHGLILSSIPKFLAIPYHGPSFVSHYGLMVSSEWRFKVLKMIQPVLSSPHSPSAVAAFEVIRDLRPFLSPEESQQLWEELRATYGSNHKWVTPTSMIYQARRSLEDPPLKRKLLPPTFL